MLNFFHSFASIQTFKFSGSKFLFMYIVCFDLEGVFTPEVWINVALKTGIDRLKLTTRDIPDYDVLMKRRLKILEENNITLKGIQNIIASMELLPGAKEFMNWIRERSQVLILSDTFVELLRR